MLGAKGEDRACEYLINKGFIILGRNFRRTFGEIDIICRSKDRILVFVEVKTLNKPINRINDGLIPEDNMSPEKLRKMKKICLSFANSNPQMIYEDAGWRMDLLALTKSEDYYEIKHYENIF